MIVIFFVYHLITSDWGSQNNCYGLYKESDIPMAADRGNALFFDNGFKGLENRFCVRVVCRVVCVMRVTNSTSGVDYKNAGKLTDITFGHTHSMPFCDS